MSSVSMKQKILFIFGKQDLLSLPVTTAETQADRTPAKEESRGEAAKKCASFRRLEN